MEQDKFKNEDKVRKIGGKVEADYYHFKSDIEEINYYLFELFSLLGLTDDMDAILEALSDGNLYYLKKHFINKVMMDIEKGKCPRYKFLSERMKQKIQSLPPEKQEKKFIQETHRSLTVLYNKIHDQYLKDYRLYSLEPRYSKIGLEVFGKALFVAPSRIEIDGEKFIEIYTSYMAAEESETKKQHEQAAEAINRFFNGLEITQKELSKYFILEYGRVKVRPTSININDYSRLGYRGAKRSDGDSTKQ